MPLFRALLLFCLIAIAAPSAKGEILASARLGAYDATDQLITEIGVGGDFELRGYVLDVRDPAVSFPGVFSAYLGVAFDGGRVSPQGPVAVAPFFNVLLPEAQVTANSLFAGGSSASLNPPPPGEQLLFSIPMRATQAGLALFVPSLSPTDENEWLLYLHESVLNPNEIELSGLSLNIVPEPSSLVLAALAAVGLVVAARRRR